MVDIESIRDAGEAIAPYVYRTPLLQSDALGRLTGASVFIKCENLQKTGSFKVRGAFNRLLGLKANTGVVAASMGNHAQAVSLAAERLGMKARIYMPEGASIAKQLGVRDYGGELVLRGLSLQDALDAALAEKDMTFVHPYDDELVIAGQGTIGLEILDEMGTIDDILVPVGGGGLISGIAVAIKALSPDTRIIGVQSRAALSVCESFSSGSRTGCQPSHTIADGIAVGMVGESTFRIISTHVDEMVSVGDDETATAIMLYMQRKRLVVEGAGAVPLAFLIVNAERFRGRRVVLLASGGNIDVTLIDRIIHRGLISSGRIAAVEVVLEDIPGSLHEVTGVIAGARGNVLSISHDRLGGMVPIGRTRTRLIVETMDAAHAQRIVGALRDAGIEVL